MPLVGPRMDPVDPPIATCGLDGQGRSRFQREEVAPTILFVDRWTFGARLTMKGLTKQYWAV
jgi:hypothetical protein